MQISAAHIEAPAPSKKEVHLSELLGALSFALDLTEGQPQGHCVRSAWIGNQIGAVLGLDQSQLWELHYAILLKDLGCSSNAARICQLFLTDDQLFKGAFKTADGSLSQALKFIVAHTGLEHPPAERFRALFNTVIKGKAISHELIETRCHTGGDIARMLRFPETVVTAIQSLDEHWNGQGLPMKLSGTDIPLYAQIALMSQVVDVFNTSAGSTAATEEIKKRAGTWFNPELVEAFRQVANQPVFWDGLNAEDIYDRVTALGNSHQHVVVDEDYLDDIAAAFARVVDNKSPFTGGHSDRVAIFTDLIASQMQLPTEHRRRLKRAALLHDIGKLGVSNAILDKNGKPTETEWAEIRRHPVLSESVLSRITAFSDLARIGGDHHERLDGGGYPRGLTARDIDLDTRIVTVADVFDALTADRPYRAAMPVSDALTIMRREIGTAFDPRVFSAVEALVDELKANLPK